MKSFESATISTSAFFEAIFCTPMKFFILFCVIIFILRVMFKPAFDANSVDSTRHFPNAIFLIIKSFLYGYLFALVFFYDFPSRTFTPWKFPEEMLLSSAFVGIFAAYEAIAGLISVGLTFIEK